MVECILCGNNQFIPIYSATLKKCGRCGFITVNMDIDEKTLKSIYSINYFMGEEYMDYLRDKEVLQMNFEKRIHEIGRITKDHPPMTNCLEIGCAYGFFGEVLLKNHKTAFKGIDIVPEAIAYGKEQLKLDMVNADYLQFKKPEIPYSDVFMWDVIEHLQHPHLYLQKIFNELVPGGRLYITTGDISAILPRIQRQRWRMIHPPSHIHYFSKYTLNMLLENIGFKVIKSSYMPTYRSLRQIYYSLFLLKKSRKVLAGLFKLIPVRWYIPINTFDIVFMTATKV